MKKHYEIEILNFDQHNKKHKKGMSYIFLSCRFFEDPKIRTLPSSGKLLYLFLLLRRGDVGRTLFVCSHDDCVTSAGGRGVVVETLLEQLESFQLLRYAKVSLNRREENRREDNIIKVPADKKLSPEAEEIIPPKVAVEVLEPEPKKPKKPKFELDRGVDERREIKQAYIKAYEARWNVTPATDNATFNSQVKNLHTKFGLDESIGIVEFYLKHNDSKYITAAHSMGMCILNCDSLRTQMLRNQPITSAQVRQMENITNPTGAKTFAQQAYESNLKMRKQLEDEDNQQCLIEK